MSAAPPGNSAEELLGAKLHKWMNEPGNMHAREALLMHRLCFDVQLAAARAGYYVNTYYDDVDHDGFDIIFDDQDTIKKMQVKTVNEGVQYTTGQWFVKKRMLRPVVEMLDKLGFEGTPAGEGNGGGVILMSFDATASDLAIEYLYTDVFILLAFEHNLIRRKHAASQEAVESCLKRIEDGVGSTSVMVPRAVFVKAKGPNELLSLAGLHSCADMNWLHQVFLVANNERPYARPKMEVPPPRERLRGFAAESLVKLLADQDLILTTS
jgi:hypothetical protein